MSIDQITTEQEAMESLIKLLEQAKRCQMLYERAHMSFPEPLKRVLGLNGNGATPLNVSSITAPIAPPIPHGAKSDWIWIKQDQATIKNVALALLRQSKAPMRPSELNEAIRGILPDANAGSLSNMATKLFGTLIERTDNGWRLMNPDKAGILSDGYFWAPKDLLYTYELAAHRRDAILRILEYFPSGLQLNQILDQLKRCAWVHAPANKDLLKPDLEMLDRQEKIRRRGNSGKWELAPKKDDAQMKLDT